MKKIYEKPQIMFESFTLSTNIAGDCVTKTGLPSNNSCGIDSTGLGAVFLENMNGCAWKATPDGENDGYIGTGSGLDTICYHVPYGNNLFAS